MTKSLSFNNDFPVEGYAVSNNTEVAALADTALDGLISSLQPGLATEGARLSTAENLLTELFREDPELYSGFLKNFANTPVIQSFATSTFVLDLVSAAGVKNPTLVTNPLLHVVSEKLILNRGKVFTPDHQDVVSTKGSVGQVVVWIPLHEIADNDYGILVRPKSHLAGMLPTAAAEFGHTVDTSYLPGLQKEIYVKMAKGDVCVFSQYLVHRTHEVGKFRIAVSFRFNDLNDQDWKKRKYFVPFGRQVDSSSYTDSRENPPKDPNKYFLGT